MVSSPSPLKSCQGPSEDTHMFLLGHLLDFPPRRPASPAGLGLKDAAPTWCAVRPWAHGAAEDESESRALALLFSCIL